MAERHISFEQLSDVMAFRVIVDNADDCYRALGLIHERWPMVPGRFKDLHLDPQAQRLPLAPHLGHPRFARCGSKSRSATREMHAQAERGLAAHWAYKEGKPGRRRARAVDRRPGRNPRPCRQPRGAARAHPDGDVPGPDLRLHPKGELIQLPKGATPVDFAYAVHTDLGDQTVGAKVNGRVVPLRTMLDNGDQVEILASKAQHPQPSWLRFVATGKARVGDPPLRPPQGARRDDRARPQDLRGDRRPPAGAARRRSAEARDQDAEDRGCGRADDRRSRASASRDASGDGGADAGIGRRRRRPAPAGQRTAISIKGLTPGVAYDLAACCHPIPGDRIVGLRREDESIEVHVIGCDKLASGIDADWLDLAWGDGSDGGTARLSVILRDVAGALGEMAGILGAKGANIVNLALAHRDGSFHTFHVDVEVHDLAHLHA